MSGFDPAWLALREPYDHAVRDPGLTSAFIEALGTSLRLVDLGAGGGSNLRFLAPFLPPDQRWICVDHDPILLDVVEATKPLAIEVSTVCLDLVAKLGDLEIEPDMGVTAAALLDLTSSAWLDRFATISHTNPVLMVLSYDGRITWDPFDPLDEAITKAFNRHQRSDKGFGPSLGPDAVGYLADRYRELNSDVRLAASDWVFAGKDRAIQLAMLDGIAGAASEIEPALPISDWKARRMSEIEEGILSLTVGHKDLLSLPA